MMKPIQYFNQGRLARENGLPATACPLRFKAWPYDAWQLGWISQQEGDPLGAPRGCFNAIILTFESGLLVALLWAIVANAEAIEAFLDRF